ncbi:MAG: sodium:solute symporter family transporter [Verrucomicrobiota bacterium]|jgi:solute:Na+ symporter, SSS family
MTPLDLLFSLAPLGAMLVAGFVFSRRGGRSVQDFVLGGRRFSWWQVGTAMVAGASNADSPLHHSGKVRRDGLTGAWYYWSQVVGQLFGALVFSRLWRRSGLTTVVEFYDLRYAGKGAAAGRGCAMVLGTFVESTFGIALGLLAVMKLSEVFLGIHEPVQLLGLMVEPGLVVALGALALAASYSVVAGLLGVVAGDVTEFLITLACSYALMFYVYRATGYHAGLREGLERLGLSAQRELAPVWGLSALVFFVFQPLAIAAGVNSINQRFLAVRDERQSALAGVWRIVNHYFVRCWPWHLCGLCSLVLLADVAVDHELAYAELIMRFVPEGVRGLMFGSLVMAFMGTASTAMHTSGAVFVNDFYRPYLRPAAADRHHLWVIRGAMVVFGAAGVAVAMANDHILSLVQLYYKVVSAAGLLMLLRWFWWRVNGWAEAAAQLVALPVALLFEHGDWIFGPGRDPVDLLAAHCGGGTADDHFAVSFILTIAATTVIWMVVMLATPPEPMEKLEEFYRRIRPYGCWGPVAARCPEVRVTDRIARDLLLYALGLVVCACVLFGGVAVTWGEGTTGAALLTAGGGGAWLLVRCLQRT